MTVKDFLSSYEKEIDKILLDEVNKIIKDMKRVSRNAILDFYISYSPEFELHSYKRTGGLYGVVGALEAIQPKPYKMKDEYGYKIVFEYAASSIMLHEGKENYIFGGPFELGFHGGPRGGKRKGGDPAPQTRPSPWETIRDYAVSKYYATVEES